MLPVFFIERAKGGQVPKAELDAAGISARWPEGIVQRPNQTGPDGRKGVVLGGSTAEGRKSLSRAVAGEFPVQWRKMDRGAAWIGVFWDDPPTEDELRRPDRVPGEIVVIGDAGSPLRAGWIVPVVRTRTGATALPQVERVRGDDVVTETKATYRALEERAVRYWKNIRGVQRLNARGVVVPLSGDAEEEREYRAELEREIGDAWMSRADQHRLALDALAVNYRIGIEEVELLELFTSDALDTVLMAILGDGIAKRFSEELLEEKKRGQVVSELPDVPSVDGGPDAGLLASSHGDRTGGEVAV